MLPVRGEAAGFVHVEHGDDNQHEEPEGRMEDITAELAGSGIVGRPREAGQRADARQVLTLIPVLLSGLRIFAVANGDRPTLVTLLSTLDVKAVLLGTFAWLLPAAFGVAAAICWIRWLQLRSESRSLGARQTTALLWLAVCTTILALILFAFAPDNDLFNLLLCLFAVYFFRKPRAKIG
jgi:hypothetical protein